MLRFLAHSKTIVWENLTSTATNCTIDDKAKVWDCHHISDTTVGAGTYISPNAMISFTKIGKFSSIGPNFTCGWGIHPLDGISTSPAFYSPSTPLGYSYSKTSKFEERKLITIGNDVFIGANVTVLDGVTIGHGAVIGAGAVVSKDIPPYAIALGCPIQIVRYRFDQETIEKLLESKWWDGSHSDLENVEKKLFKVDEFVTNADC